MNDDRLRHIKGDYMPFCQTCAVIGTKDKPSFPNDKIVQFLEANDSRLIDTYKL